MNKNLRVINNYIFIDAPLLGKGSFGIVYPVINRMNNKPYAAKRISKQMISEKNLTQQLRNEMTVHKKLDHKNIIGYYDQFCTNEDIFIILEKCNSETLEKICSNYKKFFDKDLSLKVIQHFIRQIVSAVFYMHSKGIIHRDLKLENIMIKFPNDSEEVNNKNGYFYYNENYVSSWEAFEDLLLTSTIKIIDLGFAKQLDNSGFTSSFLGTPAFVAPEILKKKSMENKNGIRYSSKVDTWSIGVIAFMLLTGRFPFEMSINIKSFNDLYLLQKTGNYYLENDVYTSLELLDFINGMLQFSESKRFSCFELDQHPYIKNDLSEQKLIFVRQINKNTKYLEMNSGERREFIIDFSSNIASIEGDVTMEESAVFSRRIDEFFENDQEIDKLFNIYTRINLYETIENDYVIISLTSEDLKKEEAK